MMSAVTAVRRSTRRSIEVSDLLIWAILLVLVALNVAFQPTFLTDRKSVV